MLQQLQFEQTPLFRIKDLSTETTQIVDTLGEVCPNQTHGPVLSDGIQSRSRSGRHVSTSFLDPALGAMMKQVCGIRGAPRLTEACPRHAWQPQGCCACVGQAVVCRASSLHLSLLRQKSEKMPIEDIHLALAPNPRVLLGSCAPSSAVSVAGGWWVAAVGFVVVLQRYRSCGSWACPGG